jgi:hypothetical protein
MFELGGGRLTPDKQFRIKNTLKTSAARLRSVAVDIDFHEIDLAGVK